VSYTIAARRMSADRPNLIAERYRIVKRLGTGGMGVVYLAEHVLLQKQFALKMLPERRSVTPDVVDNFFNEARTGARLRHENIVDVTDVGRTDSGELFLAMEYLHGRPLSDLLAAGKPLPFERIRAIAAQVCHATVAAHARDVIHCDLKPANIFLVEDDKKRDFVKILDFGLSAILEPGTDDSVGRKPAGTPQYMSPEQIHGAAAHPSFDIYALGCVLYEMATGSPPFDAPDPVDVLIMQVTNPPEPPTQRAPGAAISPKFERVILRALAKDPQKRFHTVRELEQALARCPGRGDSAGSFEDKSTAVYFGEEATPLPEPLPPSTSRSPALSLATLLRDESARPGGASDAAPPRRSAAPLLLAGALLLVIGAAGATLWWRAGAPRRAAHAEAQHIAALIATGALVAPPGDCAFGRLQAATVSHPDDAEITALRPALLRALDERARAELAAQRWDPALVYVESAVALAPHDEARARTLETARTAKFASAAVMVRAGDVWIDRYEYPNVAGATPLTRVDFPAAVDLCRRAGKQLCTEAQWERACAGPDHLLYPYAAGYRAGACAAPSRADGPSPSGSAPACVSADGASDLSGNVAEWTATPLRPGAPQMVVRGGSWSADPAHASCKSRDYFMPGQGGSRYIGFRCCR
jgi:serine/threonine protein kinase